MPTVAETKKDVLILRTTEKLKKRCAEAAAESGLSMSEWVRAVLARAANEGAFAPRKGGTDDAFGRRR